MLKMLITFVITENVHCTSMVVNYYRVMQMNGIDNHFIKKL